MKISEKLKNEIQNEYELEFKNDASEIFDIAIDCDENSLDYWKEYPYTQNMLDNEIFKAAYLRNKQTGENATIIVTGIEEEGRLWIELMALSTKYREKGIHTLLIDIAKEIGKAQNARLLLVDTKSEEEEYFYQTLEFDLAGSITKYYPNNMDAKIYTLEI